MIPSSHFAPFAARGVIMASFLYYRHDLSVMSDAEFDDQCDFVAFRWLALTDILRWQLGSAHDIRAGGSHCKITRAGEGGAITWALKSLGVAINRLPEPGWTWSETWSCEWISAG